MEWGQRNLRLWQVSVFWFYLVNRICALLRETVADASCMNGCQHTVAPHIFCHFNNTRSPLPQTNFLLVSWAGIPWMLTAVSHPALCTKSDHVEIHCLSLCIGCSITGTLPMRRCLLVQQLIYSVGINPCSCINNLQCGFHGFTGSGMICSICVLYSSSSKGVLQVTRFQIMQLLPPELFDKPCWKSC